MMDVHLTLHEHHDESDNRVHFPNQLTNACWRLLRFCPILADPIDMRSVLPLLMSASHDVSHNRTVTCC